MSFEKGTRVSNDLDTAEALLKANGITEYSIGTEPNNLRIIVIDQRDIAKVESQLIALGFARK